MMSNELERILQELKQPASDALNMSHRVELCEQALKLLPKTMNKHLWGVLQVELGNSLLRNPQGNRAESLEQAIYHYQQALDVFIREQFPTEWAVTQNNLGEAYRSRILGEPADNLERAIHHCEQALEVRTRQQLPVDWAMSQNNLGIAYAARILGEPADNLERSIYHYEQALEVRTRQQLPIDWAATQNNLGEAYRNRILGERSDNLERAIHHYEQALEVYFPQQLPIEWATTQNNLGIAYAARILGEPADNLERAIHHYEQALEVRTRQQLPVDWAATRNNLGEAYRNRILGARADNLERAIHHYEQALEVRTRQQLPVDWAASQHNLGTAYTYRILGKRADNLERAIHHCEQALEVRTRQQLPVDWAMSQNNLGIAYAARILGERADNLERAIHHYGQALEVRTRQQLPVDWAATQNNLGNAYRNRILGARADNLERAIHHYEQALEMRTRQHSPVEHQLTLNNLARLYFDERRWVEAYQSCRSAIAVGADIFSTAYSDGGRHSAVGKTGQLFIRAAYSALQLKRPKHSEAFQLLEAGKARLLAEALALGNANLVLLDGDERELLRSLREQVRGLEYNYRLPPNTFARRASLIITDELRNARLELRTLIDQLRTKYPAFMPERLALPELLALIPPNAALVTLLCTSHGSAIFIVPSGAQEISEEHIIRLDSFTLDDLNALTRGTAENPGWLRYYDNFRVGLGNTSTLFKGIDDVTRRLWTSLVIHIHSRLELLGVEHVIVMPQGGLSLLPIHAAWRELDGKRCYFLDDYKVTFTPSMASLASAKRHKSSKSGALVGGISDYAHMKNLPNACIEAQNISALFGISPLLNADVSIEALKAGTIDRAYLHLACHGGFGWTGDPLASTLYLGNDEPLSLPQITALFNLASVRLTVLSACETGIVDFVNMPDEFMGLPAGFIQAGAGAVVSSLWMVDDRSTTLLMERMYKNHLEQDIEPAEALRQAQFWLRDSTANQLGNYYQSYLVSRMGQDDAGHAFVEIMMRAKPDEKPYSHPFYWAAFTYSGL